MTARIAAAVAVQVALILLVPIRPLWVRATGTTVYLETQKMDPRDLLRGDYVVLGYRVGQNISATQGEARPARGPIYVTVTTERPARFVAASAEPPVLHDGEACLVGRQRGWNDAVDFPQIAQFYVPEGTGHAIEARRGDELLAKVAVSDGCDAVLLGLEER